MSVWQKISSLPLSIFLKEFKPEVDNKVHFNHCKDCYSYTFFAFCPNARTMDAQWSLFSNVKDVRFFAIFGDITTYELCPIFLPTPKSDILYGCSPMELNLQQGSIKLQLTNYNKYECTNFQKCPMHSPFYSAPSIFTVFRNLVQEVWCEKYGSRNLVQVVDQKKRCFYTINQQEIWFEKSGWPEKKN